ncbi:MAG: tail fiber domain-containing protein [Planctomycetota bacterium]|nr:tail fiber domain-containing protein [Planctomycetota bacterium]
MLRKTMTRIALTLALAAGSASALAQPTAFTYQGQLKNAGAAVNTPTDIQYALFDSASGGTQIGSTVTRFSETVTNGLFTSEVDFGSSPFTTNDPRYLQISVRNPAGVGAFVPMGSRQLLSAAPYSLATRGLSVSSDYNQVGIGTTSPQSMLHVVGTGFFTDLDVPYGIFETAADPDPSNRFGPQVRLKHGGPGGQDWVMVSGGAGNGPAGTFQLVRNGAPSAAFAADTTGWAGIGRSSSITGLVTEAFGVATKPGNAGYNGMIVDSAATNGLPYYGYSVGGQLKGWTTVNSTGQMEFWNNGSLNITVAPTGNVGLGVSPQARLHNPGSTRLDGVVQFGSTGQNGNTMTMQRLDGIANQSGFVFNIAPASSPNLASFNIYRNGASVYYLQLDGTASKPGGGAWAALCDERTKSDIQPLTGTLDRLLKLKGHSYSYKSEFVEKGRALPGTQIGLVAQEVETVFPDWVTTGADGMKQVTERSTTALMVEALRDLRTEKDAEIAALKARLEQLESLIRNQSAVAAK